MVSNSVYLFKGDMNDSGETFNQLFGEKRNVYLNSTFIVYQNYLEKSLKLPKHSSR